MKEIQSTSVHGKTLKASEYFVFISFLNKHLFPTVKQGVMICVIPIHRTALSSGVAFANVCLNLHVQMLTQISSTGRKSPLAMAQVLLFLLVLWLVHPLLVSVVAAPFAESLSPASHWPTVGLQAASLSPCCRRPRGSASSQSVQCLLCCHHAAQVRTQAPS